MVDGEIPYGYCQCGCGQKTKVQTRTTTQYGLKKGEPARYIAGHFNFRHHPYKMESHYKWNGGRRLLKTGYVLVMQKDHPSANRHGYVPEHVLVAERMIGGYLPKGAHVHHINGIKDDNREENLKVFATHKEHMQAHRKARASAMCGHENWIKCANCGEWDDPKNLVQFRTRPRAHHHPAGQCPHKGYRNANGEIVYYKKGGGKK